MDGFIDKFAQKRNAQEMIRANAMAEAEEKERMASQLSEYEMAMQEMRRCNLQTMENAEKVRELLTAGLNKIEEVQQSNAGMDQKSEALVKEIRDLSEELKNRMTKLLERQENQMEEFRQGQESRMEVFQKEQESRMTEFLDDQGELIGRQNIQIQELMETQKKTIEELFHATEDFNHKEAVKVYRNVQAVIESALPKQTEEIKEAWKNEAEEKETSIGFKIIWILTFIAALANVSIEVLKFLGYM